MAEVGTTTLVITGVSGSGKSTVGQLVAQELHWRFAEGDDFHSEANLAKMRAGHPLDDADRWPWLRSIADWISEQERAGEPAVVTCSALKRAYRDRLRDGHPSVLFVLIDVPAEVLRERLAARKDHFMPASLLESQLATLEALDPEKPGLLVSGTTSPAQVSADLIAEVRRLGRLGPLS